MQIGLLLGVWKEEKGDCEEEEKDNQAVDRDIRVFSKEVIITGDYLWVNLCVYALVFWYVVGYKYVSLEKWIIAWSRTDKVVSVWRLLVTLKKSASVRKKSGHWTLKQYFKPISWFHLLFFCIPESIVYKYWHSPLQIGLRDFVYLWVMSMCMWSTACSAWRNPLGTTEEAPTLILWSRRTGYRA